MAANNFIVVYGATTGRKRRVIMADTDAEIDAWSNLRPGEAFLKLAFASLPDTSRDTLAKAIATATGKDPDHEKRCVAVLGGVVTQAGFVADATIDTIPNHTLIEHP